MPTIPKTLLKEQYRRGAFRNFPNGPAISFLSVPEERGIHHYTWPTFICKLYPSYSFLIRKVALGLPFQPYNIGEFLEEHYKRFRVEKVTNIQTDKNGKC